MYIEAILEYLIWPFFIYISWQVIVFSLAAYEKKFPVKEQENSQLSEE